MIQQWYLIQEEKPQFHYYKVMLQKLRKAFRTQRQCNGLVTICIRMHPNSWYSTKKSAHNAFRCTRHGLIWHSTFSKRVKTLTSLQWVETIMACCCIDKALRSTQLSDFSKEATMLTSSRPMMAMTWLKRPSETSWLDKAHFQESLYHQKLPNRNK